MSCLRALLFSGLLMLGGLAQVHAASFSFTFQTDSLSLIGKGNLTTDDTPGDFQFITSVAGSVKALIDADTMTYAEYGIDTINDDAVNILNVPALSAFLSFFADGVEFDLTSPGAIPSAQIVADGYGESGSFVITPGSPVSTVPLPSTAPLMAAGLVALGVAGWRQGRRASRLGHIAT